MSSSRVKEFPVTVCVCYHCVVSRRGEGSHDRCKCPHCPSRNNCGNELDELAQQGGEGEPRKSWRSSDTDSGDSDSRGAGDEEKISISPTDNAVTLPTTQNRKQDIVLSAKDKPSMESLFQEACFGKYGKKRRKYTDIDEELWCNGDQ